MITELLYCLLSSFIVMGLYLCFEIYRRKNMRKITGTITVDCLDKDDFSIYFEATIYADYYYSKAIPYTRNGDGYPEESETEITDIVFDKFEIWNDGIKCDESFVKAHPEYKKFCEKWIRENEDKINWDMEVVA